MLLLYLKMPHPLYWHIQPPSSLCLTTEKKRYWRPINKSLSEWRQEKQTKTNKKYVCFFLSDYVHDREWRELTHKRQRETMMASPTCFTEMKTKMANRPQSHTNTGLWLTTVGLQVCTVCLPQPLTWGWVIMWQLCMTGLSTLSLPAETHIRMGPDGTKAWLQYSGYTWPRIYLEWIHYKKLNQEDM